MLYTATKQLQYCNLMSNATVMLSTHYRLLTFVLHERLLIQSNETDGRKPQPLPGNSRTRQNNNMVHSNRQHFKRVTFKCLWCIANEHSWLVYLQQHTVKYIYLQYKDHIACSSKGDCLCREGMPHKLPFIHIQFKLSSHHQRTWGQNF